MTVKMLKCFRSRRSQLIVSISTLFLILYYASVSNYAGKEVNYVLVKRSLETILEANFVKEQDTVCKMPKLDPFAPEMMKFMHKVDKIVCKEVEWVECFLAKCKVKDEILAKMKDIECIYKDILYIDDDNYDIGAGVKVLQDQPYYLNRSDLVKVSCKGVDRKGLSLMRQRWGGNKAGFRPVKVSPTNSGEKRKNILLLLFDSTSRNSFMRLMPKSLKYLIEELKAVVMNSYNVVGDGTSQAMFPILTGHSHLELPNTRRTSNNTRKVDPKHFIFHWLKTYGYRTAYFEDSSHSTFSYGYNGFSAQPADHYLLPLFQDETKWWSYIIKTYNCMGSIPVHNFLFNMTRQFFLLPSEKFCVTFSSTLSHDDQSMLNVADDDLVEFLKGFQSWGRNDTLLFVMADHGCRFASIRNTYQGNLEERMPFVSVVIPEWFKTERPLAETNLKANSDILTTPYDMHATILDFLDLNRLRKKKKLVGSKLERALSFFKSIPKTRTCAEAFVSPHHCACSVWHTVPKSDPMYNRAGTTLAAYIDSLTSEVRLLCAPRNLILIEWVLRMDNKDNGTTVYYQAKIQMTPGTAMYEGSMEYSTKDDKFLRLNPAEISRTNAYGDEPACIREREPSLRMFCYCKDRLTKNDVITTNTN